MTEKSRLEEIREKQDQHRPYAEKRGLYNGSQEWWENVEYLLTEVEQLHAENERFRTSSEKQCTTVYFDLVELLGVKDGGSVIEAVEQLRAENKELKHQLSELGNEYAIVCHFKKKLADAEDVVKELMSLEDVCSEADMPRFDFARAYFAKHGGGNESS